MNAKRNLNIPEQAQWLSGIVGSGSWFFISAEKSQYRIQRLSSEGKLECDRLFTVDNNTFDLNILNWKESLNACLSEINKIK